MAFRYSFVRKASASILPLGIRSAGGSVNVEKRHLIGRKFLLFSRFSTSSVDCVRLIDSDYNPQKSSNMLMHIPNDEFPFEIEENKGFLFDGRKKYIFRRKYQDEIIHVASNKFQCVEPAVPMSAYIYKGNDELRFEMVVEPNQIHISSFTMRAHVTEHLNCFQNYLEIRGFNATMIDYLFNCVWNLPDRIINGFIHAHLVFRQPGGFPFQFVDGTDCRKGLVLLERQFEDEKIQVRATAPWGRSCTNENNAFAINVKSVHGDVYTDFEIKAIPHDSQPIRVAQMSMRAKSGHLEVFRKFWEVRGIKPCITNYLLDFFKK